MLERAYFRGAMAATALLVSFAGAAVAQEIRQVPLDLAADSVVHVAGEIEGYEGVDYVFESAAGATVHACLETNSTANYFNVLPPDSESALFIGSISGECWEGELPAGGEYRIRVYLVRSAARRNESAAFTLSVQREDPVGGE